MRSFAEDLRAVLVPQRKWHYVFHLVTMLVASSYWLGSCIKLPEASWAEIAMYRPRGDNQIYPVIAALSQLNFGDPTDALHHGKGTAGSQVVPLLPYAIAYKLLGIPGYMVTDIASSLVYFVALVLLLRSFNFGHFSSLLLGTALATRSLQLFCAKLGQSFSALLSVSKLAGTWEWGFPDLFDLHIFVQRIPRPMGTEIFVLLLLYFLLRQWKDRQFPSFRRGLAIGSLFILLLQGDPFSLAALGLLFLWVMGWTLAANGWRVPWQFLGGAGLGVIGLGWYFVWQRLFEHPDSVIRFGLADYPRDQIIFLPGYAPLIRVGVICLLAFLVIKAARRTRETDAALSVQNKTRAQKEVVAEEGSASTLKAEHSIEKSIATFCVALMVAGYLAQPVQLLLLGKGTQIYHYLIFVLPTLYSYALVMLVFNFLKLTVPPDVREWIRGWGHRPQWTGAVVLTFLLVLKIMVGIEHKVTTVSSNTNARGESNVPWAYSGDLYRPSFRALEKQFRENPALKEVRTFATFCYEVNFLLAGFYDKRAYLPDNAFSTLSDEELEDRLLETLKIVQLPANNLVHFIQANFVLNYWFGCAKYWMTSDYQYSTRTDYTDHQWAELQKQAPQSPWILALPNSELRRVSEKYNAITHRKSDRTAHPDAIIVGLEREIGLIPKPEWYRPVYTNEMFSIYLKNPKLEFDEPAPIPAS